MIKGRWKQTHGWGGGWGDPLCRMKQSEPLCHVACELSGGCVR